MKLIKYINLRHFISILFIALVALIITLSNLGVNKSFVGDDAGVSVHYSSTQIKLVLNMWESYSFPGRSNVIATLALIHTGLIYILSLTGISANFIDRLIYFLFYFISGLGVYFLCFQILKELFQSKINPVWIASLTGGVYYMTNNFTMILLSFPLAPYIYSYTFLPLLFLLYLKDYHLSNLLLKRFVFVFVFMLILSGNPGNTISIFFLFLFYELFFRENNRIVQNWKKLLPTILLIILISGYIYLPVLGNRGNPYGKVSTSDNQISIIFNSVNTSFLNLFRFRGHPAQDNFVFNKFLLDNGIIILNFFIPIFALSLFLIRKIRRTEIFLLLVYLLFLFLAKADHVPFTWINSLIYSKVPLFEMYRAAYFKFIYFCVFAVSIMLPIAILAAETYISKHSISAYLKKIILIIPIIIIFISAKPFLSGEVARDIHKTVIPPEYNKGKTYFSNIRLDYSILSLPQLYSGLVLDWGNGNYYAGDAHPDVLMLDKPVWSNGLLLPREQISTNFYFYQNIISKSNIKYILLHKDIPEKYSFQVNLNGILNGQTSYKKLNYQLTSDMNYKLVENNRFFNIFEINRQNFKPHFYVPMSKNIFLEFAKINMTKYRIIIHKAKSSFRLVFSDNFDTGWKIYQPKQNNLPLSFNPQLNNYFIIAGNETDQASRAELKQFIKNGLVTTLGNKKNDIRFISKNFQNTIQNDNLPSGQLFETRFMNLIEDNKNHFLINDYDNGWILNSDTICRVPNRCKKNPDGSYDFELVVEFWPQQLFYIGIIISGLTILSCFTFLLYSFIIPRKINET